MTDYDVVIVGGGIAGLLAAWRLRSYRILLLEADNRLGGRIKSVKHGDYWANVGAHVYPHAESHMGQLAGELGLDVREVEGSPTAVGMGDRIVNPSRVELLPLVLNLSVRERISLVRAGLKLALGIRQVNRIEKDIPSNADEELRQRMVLSRYRNDESFDDFVGALPGRVRGLFDCVARRAAAEADEVASGTALLCCAHVMGPKNAPAATARVVLGGTEQVVHRLSRELGTAAVVGAQVRSVTDRGDHVAASWTSEGAIRRATASAAIVATPAHVARQIIDDIPPALDDALSKITYGAFLSMAIFTDEHGPLPIDDIYAVSTPGHEIDFLFNHAQILRTGPRRPGGALMCYRGGPRAATLMRESDEVIEQTFLGSVFTLVPELRGHVVRTVVQRWPLGTVYAAPGRATVQRALESGFDHDRIALAGDYFDPLSGMEQAARAADRAVGRVRLALPPLPDTGFSAVPGTRVG